jgi:uncharacterized RDD family membrane protein YckC
MRPLQTWVVTTREGVAIHYELADLGSRATAFILDCLVELGLTLVIAIAAAAAPGAWRPYSLPVALTLILVLGFAYFIVLESLGGQTVGKRLLRIRVLRLGGAPCGWVAGVLRNVMRLIDVLPFFFGVGVATILFTGQRQRVGDLVAGTVVVSLPRTAPQGLQAYVRPDPSSPVSQEVLRVHASDLADTLERAERLFERQASLLPEVFGNLAAAPAQEAAAVLGSEPPLDPVRFLGHLLFLREELALPESARRAVDQAAMPSETVDAVLKASEAGPKAGRQAQRAKRAVVAAWRRAHPESGVSDDEMLWRALVHRAWRQRLRPGE